MTDVCLLNLALSDLIIAVTLPLWASLTPNLVSCKIMTGVYQVGRLWEIGGESKREKKDVSLIIQRNLRGSMSCTICFSNYKLHVWPAKKPWMQFEKNPSWCLFWPLGHPPNLWKVQQSIRFCRILNSGTNCLPEIDEGYKRTKKEQKTEKKNM